MNKLVKGQTKTYTLRRRQLNDDGTYIYLDFSGTIFLTIKDKYTDTSAIIDKSVVAATSSVSINLTHAETLLLDGGEYKISFTYVNSSADIVDKAEYILKVVETAREAII